MQTRYQLATLKKGALSVAGYFQKAQTLAHTLSSIEEPLKDSGLISYILASLNTDYDSLVTSSTTRVDPISLEDLYGHMLTHEQRIEHNTCVTDLSAFSINIAKRNSSSSTKTSRPPSSKYSQYNGRGRVVAYRLKVIFPVITLEIVLCVKFAIKLDTLLQSAIIGLIMHIKVILIILMPTSHPSWYDDTGSTHDLTNDLSNLNMRAEEYIDTDQIKVGSGQGLQIFHTSFGSIPSHH